MSDQVASDRRASMASLQSKHGPPLDPTTRMKQLVDISQRIEVDRLIPVTRYFNSGRELLKTANSLEEKGELDKAFLYYLRYITLFLEKIIHHPGYASADVREKQVIRTQCNIILDMAEGLKKKVMSIFEAEYKAYQEKQQNPNSKPSQESPHVIQSRSIGDNQSSSNTSTRLDLEQIDQRYNFSTQTEENSNASREKSVHDTWEEELNQKLDELKRQ